MSNHIENCCGLHITDQITHHVISIGDWESSGDDTDQPEQAQKPKCLCHVWVIARRHNWLEQGIFFSDSYERMGHKSEGGSDLTLENQAETSGLYPSFPGEPLCVMTRGGR